MNSLLNAKAFDLSPLQELELDFSQGTHPRANTQFVRDPTPTVVEATSSPHSSEHLRRFLGRSGRPFQAARIHQVSTLVPNESFQQTATAAAAHPRIQVAVSAR